MRTDQVHVHQANSEPNKFKHHFLENESLNGKILSYILHLFSRVRTHTITSYRLFAAVQFKLSQPRVYRISKLDFPENKAPCYKIWLSSFFYHVESRSFYSVVPSILKHSVYSLDAALTYKLLGTTSTTRVIFEKNTPAPDTSGGCSS